ncbi:MAG: putative gamma-glutamylcyclotransferase [Gemmatales bacterium]|nr:MAG: putative gamma-glutamylcyclotransferase [Gemmatales bacterium]
MIDLFVYGTLKRQASHHHLLHGEFLGEVQTQPVYRLYDCGRYPGMVEVGTHGVAVHGELWRVSDEVLAVLDEYEGELFERRQIRLMNGRMVWAYLYRGMVETLSDCGTVWHEGESSGFSSASSN